MNRIINGQEFNMANNHITIKLTENKIKELINAYNLLGNLLETILPREQVYQKKFQLGLEEALKEVETGQAQKARTFDEFVE